MLFKKTKGSFSAGICEISSPLPTYGTSSKHGNINEANEHTGRVGRFYNKTKGAIKRKLSKAANKATLNLRAVFKGDESKAAKEQAKRASYLSACSGTTAVEALCAANKPAVTELADTMPYYGYFESLAETIETSGLSSFVCEPELELGLEQQDVSVVADDYYKTVVDERSTLLYCFEELYHFDLDGGMYRHMDDPHKVRMEIVDWLSYLSSLNGYSRKTLQLAILYLDLFLCDFEEPIRPGRIWHYALACLLFAMMSQDQTQVARLYVPESSGITLASETFQMAAKHVIETLGWFLKYVNEGDNEFVWQVVDMPTVHDFLELIFHCAATLLPARFAEDMEPDMSDTESLSNCSWFDGPRQFAALPFVNASDIADVLLHDQDSLHFAYSELAAACFYIVAEHEGINDSIFEQCTGYTVAKIRPAIRHARVLLSRIYGEAGPDMGATPCCWLQSRYPKDQ